MDSALSSKKKVVVTNLHPVRLNFLAAGVSGMGKSTFLNMFFLTYGELKDQRENFFFSADQNKSTVQVGEVGVFILEAYNMMIEVHLVDTPGYGDGANNQVGIDVIKKFVIAGHEKWSSADYTGLTTKDREAQDERTHGIFYFISSHRLRSIDIEFLLQLSDLAPLMLIIGKSDTMTDCERWDYLLVVRDNLRELEAKVGHPIVYDFEESPDTVFMPPDAGPLIKTPLAKHIASRSSLTKAAPTAPAAPTAATAVGGASLTVEAESVHEVNYNFEGDSGGTSALSHSFYHVGGLSVASSVAVESRTAPPHSLSVSVASVASVVEPALPPTNDPAVFANGDDDDDEPRLKNLPRMANIFGITCAANKKGQRVFQWGTVDINNREHSDFLRLQDLMFKDGKHLIRMRDLTDKITIRLHRQRLREAWVKMFRDLFVQIRQLLETVMVILGWSGLAVMLLQYCGIVYQMFLLLQWIGVK